MPLHISVCIPVYNCGAYLGQALDSILPQAGNEVEVIVFDGGSTDGTRALMERYVSAWPNLKYFSSHKRGGIDADLATCVDLAQAEYCWLFSGDDVMRPGAIQRLLQWIEQGQDVYICKHTMCSKSMTVLYDYPVLLPDAPMQVDFSEASDRRDWFTHAATTEAFFSFMSGLVIRRAKWQEGRLPNEFDGSCWGHVARLFGLIDSGLSVCYVAEIWLDQRGDNDSFADKGVVNRFRIAIEGYHRLADCFFGHKSIEAFHIRRVIRNEFRLTMFLDAKLASEKDPARESLQLLNRLVEQTYLDFSLSNFLNHALYKLVPAWAYGVARAVYSRIRFIPRMLSGAR